MTEIAPSDRFELPDFGSVVARPRLVRGLGDSPPAVLLLTAPGGYGKSVLAAQIARERGFTKTAWIGAAGVDSDREALAKALWASLGPSELGSGSGATVAGGGRRPGDASRRPVRAGNPGTSTCVVLDDLKAPDLDALVATADVLREATDSTSILVVTTRDDVSVFSTAQVCVITAESLELTEEEADELVCHCSGRAWTEGDRRRLVAASGHWTALLSVLVRQASLTSIDKVLSGSISTDLHAHLHDLAEQQLTSEEIRVLYAMSLLGRATPAELRRVCPGASDETLGKVASILPLVRLDERSTRSPSFRVHDLARAAFSSPGFTSKHVADAEVLVRAACTELDTGGRHDEVLMLASQHLDLDTLAAWTEKRGAAVLSSGGVRFLQSVLDSLGPSIMLQNPHLLILHARLLRETSAYEEALRKAAVARDIARFEENSGALYEALMMMARMQMDLGKMEDAAASLERALSVSGTEDRIDSRVLVEAYLGLCRWFIGDWEQAELHSRAAMALAGAATLPADVSVKVMTSAAATLGIVRGRWDEVLSICLRLRDGEDMSVPLSLQCYGNTGSAMAELGLLPRAEDMLRTALRGCREHGLQMLEFSFTDSMAVVQAGMGRYSSADELTAVAIAGFDSLGDALEMARVLAYQSVWTRAAGNSVRGLELAEIALEYASTLSCRWLTWSATLEFAACLCGLGDLTAAAHHARHVRGLAQVVDARRHWLTADMILAEVARAEGRPDEGIARLVEHEDYILTESANWQIAMYVRAFPHLLGMLAAAIGPEALPVHLLRMVLPQDAERTLASASELLDDEVWRSLASRVVGKTDAKQLEQMRETPQCYVRLFGGLEVRIGDRQVIDKHWRKRKARLMFAMLVARRGSEMPREQIFEQLWPEMDEPRARNNFYVIWGAMKAALVPRATKSTPCPYAENAGGMCRVVRQLVTSDVEEFEQALADATQAERQNNPTRAIRAYEQLADVYRGELLPGDIYEDWFAQMRDTFRVEFGDAMLRASRLLEREGDTVRALLMIRRGVRADPSREDLYQAALSVHIAAGQRSAAIETYTSCRKRLADELGLDPSSETLRLYEQVLAMEDPAEDGWADPDVEAESEEQ